jgi:cell volume regulation protein A
MEILAPLTIVALIILLGFIGDLIFRKTDIPNVIWLLGLGLLIGPIFKVVDPTLFLGVSEFIAALAIIIIIFEGGIHMDIYRVFKEAPRGMLLSISAFLLSVLVTTGIMFVLGESLLKGVLLGAIIGGTNSALVIPVVSRLKGISEATKDILSIESAANDIFCLVIVIAIVNMLLLGNVDVSFAAQTVASAFSVGAVMGILVGLFWIPLMKKLEQEEFSYVVTLAMLFLLYAGVEALKGSGAIACLVFGIVLANGSKIFEMIQYKDMGYALEEKTKQFHSLISFFIRTFFFVYLGMLVSVSDIRFIGIGLVLSAAVLFVRPLAVRLSIWKAEFTKRDEDTMTIMFPRGLACAVMAFIPVSKNIHGAKDFVDIAFVVILATTIICTVTMFWIKRKFVVEETKKEKKEEKRKEKPKVVE